MNNIKLLFTAIAAIALAGHACGQYYYTDVVVLKETNRQYQAIKTARISSITAKSFESDGQPTENFLLQQDIRNNQVTTSSNSVATGASVSVSYYTNNLLSKTVDNDSNINSTVTYVYDAAGNIQNITTAINDTLMGSNSTEVHLWFYNGNEPTRMLRVKDKTDTTVIDFVKDEQGNIAEEHWRKRGRNIENYFYYYNSAHQLTDIVRFNLRARKMLPDFLFEYDDKGLVTQLTQVQQNTGSYLVWRYTYNANGLKQKEAAYDKLKRPVGSIEYTYR